LLSQPGELKILVICLSIMLGALDGVLEPLQGVSDYVVA
jgi:hypothetical protein